MRFGRSGNKRGAAMMELALLSPWIVFLFIGMFDCGFYTYSLITIESATRAAAVWNASQGTPADSGAACTIVMQEMQAISNMGGVTNCGAAPLIVTAAPVNGPDNVQAAQVSVTYTTPSLIPIPGLLAKQFTITRVVTIRV